MNEATVGPTQKQILKVALASIVGSVIEQYDFLVTGVIAATVWGGVFFKLPGVAAVAAAIGVYGIGIIIRPVGAYIFGNIADRRGRKDALVYALVLMGVSTLLIGLTPTYDSIGVIAPVLLIVFRLLQGISFGAEFGTASTWVVEQAARLEVPRLLGRVGRLRDPDRAAAGLRLGDLRQVADDAGAISSPGAGVSCSSSASWWRSSASLSERAPRTASCSSSTRRESKILEHPASAGLARHAATHPAHLAGERDVRRRVLPLLRVRHQPT